VARRTAILLIFLPLVAGILVPVGSADGTGAPFALDLTSRGPFQVEGFGTMRADEAAISVRTYEDALPRPALRIHGSAGILSIHRFETAWPEADLSPVMGPGGVWHPFRIKETTLIVENASFRFALDRPYGAAILQIDAIHASVESAGWNGTSVVNHPMLVSGRPDMVPGSAPHSDERAAIGVAGSRIFSSIGSGFEGAGQGQMGFYWSKGVLTAGNASWSDVFESRSWYDQVATTPPFRLRHAVWHEIRAENATVRVGLPRLHETEIGVFLAAKQTFDNAKWIAFDSSQALDGTLPDSHDLVGSSLWIRGNMSASLDGARDPSGSAYRAAIGGTADAVASGGSAPYALGGVAALTTVTLIAVLAGVLSLFREPIESALSRFGVGLYAKLRPEKILKSGARQCLLGIVRQTPGIHFSAIKAHAASDSVRPLRGTGLLLHHLDQLERHGHIVSHREGRFRRYFARDSAVNGDVARIAALRTEPLPLIARCVLEHPESSQKAIHALVTEARSMGLSTLQYHLSRLVEHELVESVKSGRRRLYMATDNLRRLGCDLPS
jgi:predicted transcriptional regulator